MTIIVFLENFSETILSLQVTHITDQDIFDYVARNDVNMYVGVRDSVYIGVRSNIETETFWQFLGKCIKI